MGELRRDRMAPHVGDVECSDFACLDPGNPSSNQFRIQRIPCNRCSSQANFNPPRHLTTGTQRKQIKIPQWNTANFGQQD